MDCARKKRVRRYGDSFVSQRKIRAINDPLFRPQFVTETARMLAGICNSSMVPKVFYSCLGRTIGKSGIVAPFSWKLSRVVRGRKTPRSPSRMVWKLRRSRRSIGIYLFRIDGQAQSNVYVQLLSSMVSRWSPGDLCNARPSTSHSRRVSAKRINSNLTSY